MAKPPAPARPGPLPDRGSGTAEGLRRIVAVRLLHLRAHEGAARDGAMEGVHQMRVALRQLRAVLVLFAPLLEPGPAARFEAELKRLGQVLGAARDWDVFCTETLPGAFPNTFPGAPGTWQSLLGDAASRERVAAHARLAAALSGPATDALVAGLAAWAGQEALSGTAHPGRPLHRDAPALLNRLARKAAKRGRGIAGHSAEELHALRKSLKKLRYGVEDLAPLFPRGAVKSYRGGLKELQEMLGGLNDAAMAASLAGQLGQAGPPALRDAAAALVRWAGLRRGGEAEALAAAWGEFAAARPFWR